MRRVAGRDDLFTLALEDLAAGQTDGAGCGITATVAATGGMIDAVEQGEHGKGRALTMFKFDHLTVAAGILALAAGTRR